MRKLVVGDVHFGIKSNSLQWLESQLKFFETQIFDSLKEKNIDQCIYLGDLHDIRYSVNQQIGIEIKNLFRKMLNEFPNIQFIIIAGNHDYYSPLEEFAYYNFYELLFDKEFLTIHKNLKIVNSDPWIDIDGSLFLPWYWTENTDHFDEILYNYDFGNEVKAIYCHADLVQWPGARIGSLKGCPVYSGHIHNIYEDKIGNLYNLGSAVSLTYNDVNQPKYLYIIEDHKIVEKIENITTPRFKRLYNNEIFEVDADYFENAFVELCISSNNINKAKYIDRVKYIKMTYINSNIRLHVIFDDTNVETLHVQGFNTNISKYIHDNIPAHLDNKYEKIKNKLLEA